MEPHSFLIYMVADNDLSPYAKLNDLKEIQRTQASVGDLPLAVQLYKEKYGNCSISSGS